MFSLVAGSQGNSFPHRHQFWFGLSFGCKFLENKSLDFCQTFESISVCFVVWFATVFSLVVGSEGNSFSIGINFGLIFLLVVNFWKMNPLFSV